MKNRFVIIKLLSLLLCSALLLCSCKGEADKGGKSNSEENAKRILPPMDGEKIICIDPGHGFQDIGCDTDLLDGDEASVTLEIALLLKEELEKHGCRVILTHDGKSFPSAKEISSLADKNGIEYSKDKIIDNDIFSPYERAIWANAVNMTSPIDLFISLHVNSIEGSPSVSRYEMDYYEGNPYSYALGELCKDIRKSLDNETVIFADDYDMAFIVTKYAVHPALLLEMGYATNENDAENLNSEKWRKTFAKNLAKNINNWVASWEDK